MNQVLRVFAFLMIGNLAVAQNGSIKGSVKDITNGEAVIGATVAIVGTTTGVMADIEGDFLIPIVKVGSYKIKISIVGYKAQEMDISVYSGQTTVLNVQMQDDTQILNEVKVVGQRFTFSDVSVITEIKQATGVAVGISAEQIGKSQDRDAAQVIRRVPGISIFDDRFVVVRGLNERYNSVMLNDAISPSTEVDTRAFSFDLVPSGAIDRMIVYKSPSADLPGDFSGGVIKIFTKTVPDGNTFKIGIQTGYRTNTTFETVSDHAGGSMDWLGFDNSRQLSKSFPDTRSILTSPSSKEITSEFQKLENFYALKSRLVSPDLRLSSLLTRKRKIGNADFTSFTSLNYSNTNMAFNNAPIVFKRYETDVFADRIPNDFQNSIYQNNYRLGVMANWALILNPRNKIEFRNLFNQLANKETTTRAGSTDNVYAIAGNSFKFESRSIYSGQLSGKHDLGSKSEVNWTTGMGYTKRLEPDTRRFIQSKTSATDDFIINVPTQSSPTLEQSSRFFSNLTEVVGMASGSYEYRISKDENDEDPIKIKTGVYSEIKSRDFSARWFGYVNPYRAATNVSPEVFFQPERISNEGTYVNEGTNYDDQYKAHNYNASGFVNTSVPLGKLKITGGVRVEYNQQTLNSFKRGSGKPVDVNLTRVNALPSINTSFNFSEKSLIRASYGMTLNRPEFRELAPFTYYDFNLNASKTGNPDLLNASINNFDVRYEFYPSPSELISIGVFHKLFKNPIEQVIRYSGSGVNFSYANVDHANSSGLEIEVRKSLESMTENVFLKRMNLVLNTSIIKSSVKSSGSGSSFGERQLQGQSPYIVNAGVFYNDVKRGTQINVIYNIIGPRIVYVGDRNLANTTGLYPDQYELPRNMLDLSFIQKLNNHFEVRVGAQDILNSAFRVYQDTNLDGKISSNPVQGQDDLIQSFKRGGNYSLGINYTF